MEILSMNVVVSAIVDPWVTTFSFVVALAMRIQDPIMAIPLIFTPVVNVLIAWSAMSAGLVPLCNGIMLPGSTPPLISGFLLCGWQGALLQLVLILIDMAIYLPFIKILDREFLKEEEGAETECAV